MYFFQTTLLSLNDGTAGMQTERPAFMGLESHRTWSGTPEELEIEGGLPEMKEKTTRREGGFRSAYKLPSDPRLTADLCREESPRSPAEGKSWGSES